MFLGCGAGQKTNVFAESKTSKEDTSTPSSPRDEGWLTPGDSNVPGPNWRQIGTPCLSLLGCPFEPAHVPKCPSNARVTLDVHESNLRDHEGAIVIVRGKLTLQEEGITQAHCREPRCCNTHFRVMAVVTQLGVVHLPDRRNAFVCEGDETRLC
jgi:hypothetical protein